MTLTPDQLAFWREAYPEGFGDRKPQDHIGSFVYACVWDGMGTPDRGAVEAQIEADRRGGSKR